MNTDTLIIKAMAAMQSAYSPYSNFKVGAALLAKNGDIFTGCNIENAAFSPTICAERTAIFKAVSSDVKDFEAICIVGGIDGFPHNYVAPCGVCRQVMTEFCESDFKIILAKNLQEYKIFTLEELIPLGFGPENLLGE